MKPPRRRQSSVADFGLGPLTIAAYVTLVFVNGFLVWSSTIGSYAVDRGLTVDAALAQLDENWPFIRWAFIPLISALFGIAVTGAIASFWETGRRRAAVLLLFAHAVLWGLVYAVARYF